MILDVLENIARYECLHPSFPAAVRFLRETDLTALPDGRIDIAPDAAYAVVAGGEGRGRTNAVLEAHREAVDIQITLGGVEVIGWSALSDCPPDQPYDPEKDLVLFPDREPAEWLVLPPRFFAVFFPEDAHAPLAGDGPVRKIVVKLLGG